MPAKDSNSDKNNNSQSNANEVQNNYGEHTQGAFDELTETDDKSGLSAALAGAKVAHEGSIFDNDDDLYDDEYNYEYSGEEDEEEEDSFMSPGASSAENTNSDAGGIDPLMLLELYNSILSNLAAIAAMLANQTGGSGAANNKPQNTKPQNNKKPKPGIPLGLQGNSIVDNNNTKPNKPGTDSFDVNNETVLSDLTFDDDKPQPNNIPATPENIKPEEILSDNENQEESEGISFGSFSPIEGVVFDNVMVKNPEATTLEGTADLVINIENPGITGEALGLNLTFNPNSKEVSFLAPALSLETAIGSVEVTDLSIENGELKAVQVQFTYDSSKTEIGALISGETENKYSDLFALGAEIEIIGHDVTISQEEGFNIAEIEKQLKNLKLRVFGEDFEYNADEGQATLEKEINVLEFLTQEKEISKEMKIPIFPKVEADFKTGLEAGDTTTLNIVLEKPDDNYEFTITGDLGGLSLSAYVNGNAKVSPAGVAKADAELNGKGTVKLEDSSLEAKGSFEPEKYTGIITPKPMSFDLAANVVLPVIMDLLVKLSASFLFMNKNFEKELNEHELARFELDKSFNWQADADSLEGDVDVSEIISEDKVKALMPSPSNFLSLF